MGEEVQPSLHPWKYICILAANGRLNEGAPKEDCYGNRTKTLFQPQSMYTMALVLPLAWVHGSQLCLNGKYICINRRRLADQLLLPVPHFVFKEKSPFSFLFPPPGFSQHKRTPAHAAGQPSSHQSAGRGWMPQRLVFSCFTPHIAQPLHSFQ